MPRLSTDPAQAPTLAAGETAAPPGRRRNPWWIPPFLGSVPALPDDLLRLLGLVSLALFFESYDLSMLTSALKHIAHGLSIDEQQMGGYLGVIRLGALPAFLVIPLADRIGRRRLFLTSIVGISVFTFLTAFTQSAWQFIAMQMLSRMFMVTAVSCAVVIVTEEFPAEHRGWGIGMLGALAACGVGFGAITFSLVDVLPFGWRALYTVGVVPLLLLPVFRHGIRETSRFERSRELADALPATSAFRAFVRPMLGLVREHPARALGVAGVVFLVSVGSAPVFQFTGYFVQQVHGWAPWQYSVLVVAGGALGIIGNMAAGRLGDRYGRRRVGFVVMVVFPFFVLGFYQGPGWLVAPAWILFVFCSTAQYTITRALSTELFPTAYRGTASGWSAVIETASAALGLFLIDLGQKVPSRIATMTSMIAFTVVGAGLLILLLPETRGRELEAISGETRT